MCLKIRCDGESEKFYKILWELNKASVESDQSRSHPRFRPCLPETMEDIMLLTCSVSICVIEAG